MTDRPDHHIGNRTPLAEPRHGIPLLLCVGALLAGLALDGPSDPDGSAPPVRQFYAVASGDWSDPKTWSATSGGRPGNGPGDGYPSDRNCDALVDANSGAITVTVDTAVSIRDFAVDATANESFRLAMGAFDFHCRNFMARQGDVLQHTRCTLTCTGDCLIRKATPGDRFQNWGNLKLVGDGTYYPNIDGSHAVNWETITCADRGCTTVIRPITSSAGKDINLENGIVTGGGTIRVDRTDVGPETHVGVEINQRRAGVADISGNPTVDGLTIEHENDTAARRTCSPFKHANSGSALTVFDVTGNRRGGRYVMGGSIAFVGKADLTVEKHCELDLAGHSLTGLRNIRVGSRPPAVARLFLNGGTIKGSGNLSLGSAEGTRLDLGQGGRVSCGRMRSPSRSQADVTGTRGAELILTGTKTPSAKKTYYFSAKGSDANIGSRNSPKKTVAHAIRIQDTRVRCVFKAGEAFPIDDKTHLASPGGVWGRYGNGADPLFKLPSGATLTVGHETGSSSLYEITIRFGEKSNRPRPR